MAQSVKCLTSDFGTGHVLRIMGSSPVSDRYEVEMKCSTDENMLGMVLS